MRSFLDRPDRPATKVQARQGASGRAGQTEQHVWFLEVQKSA